MQNEQPPCLKRWDGVLNPNIPIASMDCTLMEVTIPHRLYTHQNPTVWACKLRFEDTLCCRRCPKKQTSR